MKETIYTIPEVAEYLKLSKSKVYHLVQTGQLPHIRIGKNVRVREHDLIQWIDQQAQDLEASIPTNWTSWSKKAF